MEKLITTPRACPSCNKHIATTDRLRFLSKHGWRNIAPCPSCGAKIIPARAPFIATYAGMLFIVAALPLVVIELYGVFESGNIILYLIALLILVGAGMLFWGVSKYRLVSVGSN